MIKTTLGQIADIITGPFGSQLHQKDYVDEGISVIMPQNISDRNFLEDDIAKISIEDFNRLNRYATKKNDIIFARRGDVEKHAFITNNEPALCGTGCLLVRIKSNEINPVYLSFFLCRPETKRWLSTHAVGSNMPNLNTDILSAIPIELPIFSTQEKIADILNALDDKIKNNSKINVELESMAKAVYDYWFLQFEFPNEEGKPYKSSGGKLVWNEELKREIPDGWSTTTLGDITTCHDSDRIPLSSKEREEMKGDIPYYGATGIMDYVDKAIFNGDFVLVAEDGSIMDENGRPIVQRVSGKTWINNHAHVLEPVGDYSCRLLMMLLKDVSVATIKTGSIQMKITQDNLNEIKLLNIPTQLCQSINNWLLPLDKKIIQAEQENQELIALRDFLLPLLMNGQVGFKDEYGIKRNSDVR